MTHPMECHCIPAVDVPRTSALNAAYLEDFSAVAPFFAYPPTFASVVRAAGEARLDPQVRKQVVEVLRGQNRRFGAGAEVEASLDRLASGAVAIVTGQQVGLFSGPSYTIYKALTALRLAADLSAAGVEAVPVFWLATEDHDLAEVNHVFWPTRTGPERLELAVASSAEGRRVGEVQLGEGVKSLVERAAGMLEGPDAAEMANALAQSYGSGETYGSAFGKLMARLFSGKGLILLDPMSDELHTLAAPVYRRALEQQKELQQDLLDRSKALERAGYHAQVKITDRNTLLFISVEGKRLPLRIRDQGFVLGNRGMSLDEALQLFDASPESFSPNALLRPVIQDALLPTAAYVAGPAEIAYFAQAAVTYRRLLGRMPVIMPRESATLVEARVARLLRKYNLEFGDVLRGRRHLRSRMERALLPKALARRLDAGEQSLQKLLRGLRLPVSKLDQSLAGAFDTAERKMLYQFGKLRARAARSLALRSAVLDAHEREIAGALLPEGDLQERALCFLPMLAAHGAGLLDELSRKIAFGGAQHQVLYL
jgi:bacillithiol biosynthesis cysteine-adding enzyme BshC